MEKIYCADASAFENTESAVLFILKEYFGVTTAKIVRGDNGKPFLDVPLFFSVSHTQERLFIAFCDINVGLDAEKSNRETQYLPIIKKFHPLERQEIASNEQFIRHWVVKESAVKWLGGSLAKDLSRLSFYKGALFYGEIQIPATLTFLQIDGHILSVCSERDFSQAEIINIP